MNKKSKKQKKSNRQLQKITPPELESTPVKAWTNEAGALNWSFGESQENPLKQISGTKDLEIAKHLIHESTAAILPLIKNEAKAFNIAFQAFNDFKPKNLMEAQLVSQATAAYTYAMESLARCGQATNGLQIEAMANIAVKFMRIHNETVEALLRSSRGNEQKIVVQHQNVAVSGDAFVGNFNADVGGGIKKYRRYPMFVKKCGAKARTNSYQPCRQPAMSNGKCRLHGGKSTGLKTEEGRRKIKESNMSHGFYSKEVRLQREIFHRELKKLQVNLL